MMKYAITVRYDTDREIQTNDYLMAWEIYHHMKEIYPEGTQIDLWSLTTGEVFQSSLDC